MKWRTGCPFTIFVHASPYLRNARFVPEASRSSDPSPPGCMRGPPRSQVPVPYSVLFFSLWVAFLVLTPSFSPVCPSFFFFQGSSLNILIVTVLVFFPLPGPHMSFLNKLSLKFLFTPSPHISFSEERCGTLTFRVFLSKY